MNASQVLESLPPLTLWWQSWCLIHTLLDIAMPTNYRSTTSDQGFFACLFVYFPNYCSMNSSALKPEENSIAKMVVVVRLLLLLHLAPCLLPLLLPSPPLLNFILFVSIIWKSVFFSCSMLAFSMLLLKDWHSSFLCSYNHTCSGTWVIQLFLVGPWHLMSSIFVLSTGTTEGT